MSHKETKTQKPGRPPILWEGIYMIISLLRESKANNFMEIKHSKYVLKPLTRVTKGIYLDYVGPFRLSKSYRVGWVDGP